MRNDRKFNPSGVQGGDFELMPAGKYPVRVNTAVIKPSKSSESNNLELDMVIEGIKYAGRHLWFTQSLSEKSAPFIKGMLTALGIDTTIDKEYDLIDDVLGRKCLADVIHKAPNEFHTDTREKVKMLRSLPKSGVDESTFAKEDDDLPF